MSPFVIALILFAITYVLLFALSKYRSYVALGSAVVFSVWLSLFCEDSTIEFGISDVLGAIDFNILMMIAGTMGIVSLFIESKMPMRLADWMLSKFKSVQTSIVAMAVLAGVVSAFVDNIPDVLTMLPVVTGVAQSMGVAPYVLYFGLLIGATLGGNITPIGASANITGIGILRKEGYEVKARDFMKISVPFTLTAVLSGDAFIWIF